MVREDPKTLCIDIQYIRLHMTTIDESDESVPDPKIGQLGIGRLFLMRGSTGLGSAQSLPALGHLEDDIGKQRHGWVTGLP